jgi:hypothetical protein
MQSEIRAELAVRIAALADHYGIYPHHVKEDAAILAEQRIDAAELTVEVMTHADRLFQKAINETLAKADRFNGYARSGSTSAVVTEEYKDAPAEKKERAPRIVHRARVFDYSVTAVLRWMGKNGWDVEDAFAAVTDISGEYGLSMSTVKIQLLAGKKGQRGEPAPITPSQAKTLKSHCE